MQLQYCHDFVWSVQLENHAVLLHILYMLKITNMMTEQTLEVLSL
jgi:hypothetical protein